MVFTAFPRRLNVVCGRVAIIPSSHPEEQRNLLRKNFSFAIIDMGNGIGKLPAAAYHEKNTNQSCRMEERMERLEGEIKKIKAEIDGRPQQNSFESPVLNRRPSHSINCATRTNNPGLRRLSTMSIGEQSGALVKRRGSTVVFSEKLLRAELERLRMENNGLLNQLAQVKGNDRK